MQSGRACHPGGAKRTRRHYLVAVGTTSLRILNPAAKVVPDALQGLEEKIRLSEKQSEKGKVEIHWKEWKKANEVDHMELVGDVKDQDAELTAPLAPRAQRLYHGCRRLSEGLGCLRTASRTGPPRSKAKAGDLAACLLPRKAFRKPPQRRRLSEGLGRRRTASRTGPPRSKAKAGDLAACLLRRKAFRKPPQRRRLSEGLGRGRTASRTGPPRSKAKAGDLAACLLPRKAFRKPPQRRRLSEGLGRLRTASRTGPPRSKAKAGDLAACLLRRKAFRKPPQRRKLSEGLGRLRTASRTGPPRSKAKAGDLAACLLRRKAFRKPPQRRRLSEGLGHRRTARWCTSYPKTNILKSIHHINILVAVSKAEKKEILGTVPETQKEEPAIKVCDLDQN
ncbi:hypothetical protein QTO34_008228 [Cnephaeus nilssonii]|uniref:Uncharacterized protein n=1 Tax=Cnephaeus nilssonii TaxID=3371016 RepID=A0AA40LW47_CNENI|nr:hypothetical protein QTO34_008228 [Eptesicus nilssonii]